MVVLRIAEIALDDSVNHLATDWEVSTTQSFNNVILSSIEDHDNITSISFDQVLDPNIKYYARARALLSTGYTIWSNLDVFTPNNIYDLDKNNDLPSRISIPLITTNSDTLNHDATMFTISVTGFSVIGNSTHTATSYYIETLSGDVVWSRLNEHLNKDSILVDDIMLTNNEVYRIKAIFHSSSNDSSQIGTKTIYVKNGGDISLYTDLTNLNVTTDILLKLIPSGTITNVNWEILYLK
ncbi:MAG: hypothetical protein JHC33_00170, partial [Ignisphaera sp.]|nr:hypothetical protein [Ignisphaera sp.]